MSIINNNGDFIKKNISLKDNIVQTDDFYISNEDNEKNNYSIYDNIDFPQNDNILNSILDNHQKALINNFMKEQINDIKKIEEKKNKINNINFIERNQNLKDLYKWKNLFNKSKAISSYINNKETSNIKNNTESKFDNFKFPVVLIDLPEEDVKNIIYKTEHSLNYKDNKRINNKKNDKMKKTKSLNLITKNSNFYNKYSPINSPRNNNIKFNYNNCTKPSSINSPRNKNDVFYFSQNFNDYYKESLKDFSKKLKILQPKIKINNKLLQKTIKYSKKKRNEQDDKIKSLRDLIKTQPIYFLKKNDVLNLKRTNKNSSNIIKRFLSEIYKKEKKEKEKEKNNKENKVKTINNHCRNYQNIQLKVNLNESTKNYLNSFGEIKKLSLSTYRENDPALKIFYKLNNDDEDYENNKSLLSFISNKNNNNFSQPEIYTQNVSPINSSRNHFLMKNQLLSYSLSKKSFQNSFQEDYDLSSNRNFPNRIPSANLNNTYKKINLRIQKKNFNNFIKNEKKDTSYIYKSKIKSFSTDNLNTLTTLNKWDFISQNNFFNSYSINDNINSLSLTKSENNYKISLNKHFSCSRNSHVTAKRFKANEIIKKKFGKNKL